MLPKKSRPLFRNLKLSKSFQRGFKLTKIFFRKRLDLIILYFISIFLLFLLVLVWFVPHRQAEKIYETFGTNSPNQGQELYKLENEIRENYLEILKTLGTLGFIFTAYFTWRSLKSGDEKLTIESFSRATSELSSERLESRLGAIFSLEQIANTNPSYYWTIIEILESFIRYRGAIDISDSNFEKVKPDVQAALTAIIRRQGVDPEGKIIDLQSTCLNCASLNNAHFLIDAKRIKLNGLRFYKCQLLKANFFGAILSEISFREANLEGANFSDTELDRVTFFGANCRGADFSNAVFWEVDLEHADFTGAKITAKQLEHVKLCRTKLPSGMSLNSDRDCN